jgi:hypothetical protein
LDFLLLLITIAFYNTRILGQDTLYRMQTRKNKQYQKKKIEIDYSWLMKSTYLYS